jgi:hypothetical protein
VEKKLLKFRIMDHRLEDTPQTLMFELRVVAKRDLGNTITSITAAVNITTIQGIMHRQTHRDNTVMTLAIHHQETNGQAKREIARGISG